MKNSSNANTKNTRRKHGKKKIFRRLFYVSFSFTILFLIALAKLNVLPILYFGLLSVGLVSFDFFMLFLTLKKGWKRRGIATVLTLLKIIGTIVILIYFVHTLFFLNNLSKGNFNTENYSIIVLNTSSYTKLKDIKDKKIGILKSKEDGVTKAKQYLNKKTSLEYIEVEDTDALLEALIQSNVDAILMEEAQKTLLEDTSKELKDKERIIYEFSVDIEIQDNLIKNVDITNDSFNIFISGIDSYGKITSVSRSDVNMVVSVNPKTHKVLLTSIPRDYYVQLHGIDTNLKDKITHAGIHGIDTSVKTVEDLLGIDINYYAKVNFTSLIKIVDELGGVDVEVSEPFRAYYEEEEVVNYSFKKGINHLNGKQALAFARERKSLADGDLGRVRHQQQLLEAILNKALSKTILLKYNDLLNALNGKFITNLGTENITALVKKQIKEMPSWSFSNYSLTGTDAHQYTYSYKTVKSYVMEPNLDSINEAKEKIKSLRENE